MNENENENEPNTVFKQWQAGQLSNREALAALINDLKLVEGEVKPLNEVREILRQQLEKVVRAEGDRVDWPDFGRLENTPATIVSSYNRAQLDQLVFVLMNEGQGEIAAKIVNCRQENERKGYFKITETCTRPAHSSVASWEVVYSQARLDDPHESEAG